MNNRDLVLQDIERCKKVQPIMERLGIEPDGWWVYAEHGLPYNGLSDLKKTFIPNNQVFGKGQATYRQDKLELALPEWWHKFKLVGVEFYGHTEDYLQAWVESRDYSEEILWALYSSISGRGEPKRQATVDLICLLDEEGLL